jgi:hypothetical protein
LIAEWVESPLQQALTCQPDAYRACRAVTLSVAEMRAGAAPSVSVHFLAEERCP